MLSLKLSLALILSLFLFPIAALTQDRLVSSSNAPERPETRAREQGYRIGVGDLLVIRVFGHPDLGGEQPVNNLGQIRLPMIKEIQAACLTEAELTAVITEKLSKYLRDPQVDIFVKEYRSQPVAVMGAVAHPGRFLLQRRVRLLELLANAGGPAPNAGSTVFVIHSTDRLTCELKPGENEETEADDAKQAGLTTYKLRDLMMGAPEANRYVEPGDIISIPDADQVFLTGNVLRPGPLPLKGQLTLLDAISMAGGLQPEASKKNIRVIRHTGDGTRDEMVYNLEDIEKKRKPDVLLMPNDIIAVSSSAIKNLRKSLLQIVPATVSTLPIVVLP